MQISLRVLLLAAATALFLGSCDTSLDGNLNENQAPSTSLTVDNIEVDDKNRLSSRVNISWWGDDPDGYISGFEFAISDTTESNWTFTTKTDSTFILPITPGEEVDDVLFAVRAIDNEALKDPIGAFIEFPLRNAEPTTELNTLALPPDTTYGVFSFGWSIDDPDGLRTIQRTEIAINDTANGWTEIPIEADDQNDFFITFKLNDTSSSSTTGEVYLGRSFRSTDINIDGFIPESDNKFYVRTVDRALAVSETQNVEWHLKRQTSNILVLNDDATSDSQDKLQFHLENLQELGFDVDIIDISDGTGLSGGIVPLSNAFPRVVEPTLNRMLAEWDFIYLFSNSLERNINYTQQMLSDFFENDGKLFATIPISRNQNRLGDPLFNFLPMSDFIQRSRESGDGFLIINDFEITPLNGGPLLGFRGGFQTSLWPFVPLGNAKALYEGRFNETLSTGGSVAYEDRRVISALNPEGNFLYFGMDLTNVGVIDEEQSDEDDIVYEESLSRLLDELLINRLGFTPQQ